ncbi:MAG TPA: hypothetical protein VGQ25_11690 [Gemmatimonadales bacterium]|nr:hypothetical protein [Gemmatimonadales bacterium]
MKGGPGAAGVLIGFVAAGALACGDLTPPGRTPRYTFDQAGAVFRWPVERLPVRYFADTAGAMAALVQEGLRAWERQFLYGEFRGVLVADSGSADVIVRWADSVPPDVPPDTAGAVGACGGITSFLVDSTNTMTGPMRVEVSVSTGYTLAQVAACLPRVATHEVGHTLGILTHSPAVTDLMFGSPRVQTPTGRDRATVEVLYHTTPTIGPPPSP